MARLALRAAAAQPYRTPTRYAYLGDHRGIVVLHNGARIFVDTSDMSVVPSLILYGCWEPWVESVLMRLVRPGAVVVDLGANFGYHTIALALAVGPRGKVYAFEANPRVAALLGESVAMNTFCDWVEVVNAAILDRNETVTLHVDPHLAGGGRLAFGAEEPALERHMVCGTTLTAALSDVERLDLLRMDIEGAEPLALRGAESLIRNSPDLVIVSEWSPPMLARHCDMAELVGWLVGLGFSFWQIRHDATLRPVTPDAMLTLPHSDVAITRHDLGRR